MRRILEDRRGLAEIITVILIILLSLAAIAIVWGVVKNMLEKGGNKISTSCLTGVELSIKEASCSGGNYTVKLERENVDDIIKSIKFVFSDGENSQTVELSKAAGDKMPKGLDVLSYTFDKEERGITINATKVSIAPTMEGANGDDLPCNVVDEIAC